ncbi:MAG: prolyl oligopeptidase family serine peptidase [Firmicutes bacterium]|nr:prolyl oligopeptidase family serine peptidase [Bacillota bacterium]
MKNLSKRALASLMALSMLAGCSQAAPKEEAPAEEPVQEVNPDAIPVEMHAIVTDAGQSLDKMVIDFGDKKITGVENDTFEVKMTSTVTYGEAKGQPYAYFDSETPIPVVKTETNGGVVTVYFQQNYAGTLNWLAEGRNMPAELAFTITQTKDINELSSDKRELPFTAEYSCAATSYKDLIDEETAKFEGVEADINYQFHKGTNDKLIVWFHGNGEGDFPTKDTNNNVAQMLANRGTVAWATEEAQEVFGDASVMSFQAPNVWYLAKKDNLLETAYNEIQDVIKANGINEDEIYVSGCSAGGFMTTRMIIAYPELFKAAMINCPALDIANLRSETEDATPTDEELAVLKTAKTKIWLVQGETDSSVNPEDCSKRIWKILTDGAEVTDKKFEGTAGIASGFTTYETADGKYKLSLYETADVEDGEGTLGDTRPMGKLVFAEDYNQDGELEEVKHSDHWSWIYTLRNNPEDAAGEHIWQWAVK